MAGSCHYQDRHSAARVAKMFPLHIRRFGFSKATLAVLLCVGVEFAGAAAVRTREHLIDVWTAEKGLRSSSVTSIAQTPDGYLWLGTYNGLMRFDGEQFVTFDPDNTPELKHARVRRLYVD